MANSNQARPDSFSEQFAGDWQQKKCYAWEQYRLNYFRGRISDDEAVSLIRKMSMELGLPIPKIDWRGRGRGRAHISRGMITLMHSNIYWLTPIHEFAHIVSPAMTMHGPQFVRNYIHLLARFGGPAFNEDEMFLDATMHGVCVAPFVRIEMPSQQHLTKDVDLTDLYDLLKEGLNDA